MVAFNDFPQIVQGHSRPLFKVQVLPKLCKTKKTTPAISKAFKGL